MKGQIIAVFLFIVSFVSINSPTIKPFFKIKRQRLYKNNYFEETSGKINKVLGLKLAKKKRQREKRTPLK